jgi:hypothetical protein
LFTLLMGTVDFWEFLFCCGWGGWGIDLVCLLVLVEG